MDYKSPINLLQKTIDVEIENNVLKAVQNVGIDVDKEELLKALDYDRKQFINGYNQGYNDCRKKVADAIELLWEGGCE